jgi:hypothetical protein
VQHPHLAEPARQGRQYLSDGRGRIVVESICEIALQDVTGDLARRSGFEGVVDLLKVAKHGKGTKVYLVEFHYVPPGVPV